MRDRGDARGPELPMILPCTRFHSARKRVNYNTKTTERNNTIDIKERLILQEDGKCINAFNIISSPEMLIAAYSNIKSKPGMMTKGTDDVTLDGINKE